MIPSVIFTYREDGPCTVLAAEALRRCAMGPITIVEDCHKPIDSALRRQLEGFCEVRSSSFERGRNLNGISAVAGILEELELARKGATHVFKTDADSILHRPERLVGAARDGVWAAGMTAYDLPMMGFGYLLSATFIAYAQEQMGRKDYPPGFHTSFFPEDQVLGNMAKESGDLVQWPYVAEGGYGAGYAYSKAKVPLEEYARRFEMVTFGNRYLMDTSSSHDPRQLVRDTMAEFSKIAFP